MKFSSVLLFSTVLGLAQFLSPAWAKARYGATVDAGYLAALAAANHYLAAWESGDVENGASLLTRHAKQVITMDVLEQAFSQPGPLAFEIGRGKMLRRGRYEFPVFLITATSGGVRRRFTRIVVLNTGKNEWSVDKLP